MTVQKDGFTKEQINKIIQHLNSCGINSQDWDVQNGIYALLSLDKENNINASNVTPIFYICHKNTKEMKLFNAKLVGII